MARLIILARRNSVRQVNIAALYSSVELPEAEALRLLTTPDDLPQLASVR